MHILTETANPESTATASPPADGSDAPSLRILGTPLPAWLPLATALQQAIGGGGLGGGTVSLHLSPQGYAELDAQAPTSAGQLHLVFVDNPGRALAHWLAQGSAGSVDEALASWREGAQRLLRHARRRPGSFLFVDAAEAEAEPESLLRRLGDAWPQGDTTAPLVSPGISCDPLLAVLGGRLAAADAESAALFAELQMTCVELDANAPPGAADAALTQRALRRFHRLLALEAEHRGLAATAADLKHSVEEGRSLQFAQQTEIDRLTQASAGLQAALSEYEQESELALGQMHRMQGEIESVAGQKLAVEGRLADALTQYERLKGEYEHQAAQVVTLHQTAAGLEAEAAALRAELAPMRLQAAELRQRTEQQEHADGAARKLAQNATAELGQTRQDGRALLHQLHQLQQELQEQFLQFKALEDRAQSGGGPAGRIDVHAAEVRLADVRDAPPHRQLECVLRDFRAAGRTCLRLIVRLVEHEGRPGLVLFSTTTGTEAVAAWESSGQEDGRDFMLLVPTDTHGEQMLRQMGASDWLLLLGLSALLQQEVRSRAGMLAPHWPAVAGRLCRQLEANTPRFRFDSIDLAAAPAEATAAGALDISFGNAIHGALPLGQVHLRWLPDAAPGTATLRWMLPADTTTLPLACWPLGAQGLPQDSLALPVGRGWAGRDKRRQWSALGPGEREMLLAVIDQLPAVAARAAAAGLPAGSSPSALVAQAQALCKDARQTLAGMRMRAAVRRIVRGTPQGA